MTTQPAGPAPADPAAADQRREQILAASLAVMADRGYAETRVADVAARAGVSPALVIYYFTTKERLLIETARYFEQIWFTVGQRKVAAQHTAAGKLEEILAMICLPPAGEWALSTLTLWLDLWTLAARRPEVAEMRRQSHQRWQQVIRSIVRAGQETGEFCAVDPERFGLSLSSLVDGLILHMALADAAVPPAVAFEISMRFSASELGFAWSGACPEDRQTVVSRAR